MPTWFGTSYRTRRIGIQASSLLALAVLFFPGISSPAAAQTAEPSAAVWTIAPGDAAHIQQAIDAARDAGGGAVYLPGAVYLLTAKVRVHSNVTVFGDGTDRTVLRWVPGTTVDHMMSNGSLTDGNTNIQIRDLTLDGQRLPSGRADCCFGLRLNNVRDSYVVNVAAIGHSKDGIYLGHGGAGGDVNVRISGCVVASNFRNGISLVEGDNVTIDHCRVEQNNLVEKISGIDLEPDQGLSVTNSKLVANSVTSQDVGIRLYVPYGGYATVANTVVCQNSVSDNRGAGVFDNNTASSVYVDNAIRGNRKDFQGGSGAQAGSGNAGACRLAALPAAPGVPTAATLVPAPVPAPAEPAPPSPDEESG